MRAEEYTVLEQDSKVNMVAVVQNCTGGIIIIITGDYVDEKASHLQVVVQYSQWGILY